MLIFLMKLLLLLLWIIQILLLSTEVYLDSK